MKLKFFRFSLLILFLISSFLIIEVEGLKFPTYKEDKPNKNRRDSTDENDVKPKFYRKSTAQEGLNRGFLKAAFNNDIDGAKFLLASGADVFALTETESTALHIACEKGYIRFARELIKRNASLVQATNQEDVTPMHSAALHGQVTLIQILLDHGGDINAKDIYGATPLHCAAFNDDSLLGRYLISHKADTDLVDKYDSTALHIAAHVGNKVMITALVMNGVPIDAQDKGGSTALHLASYNGHNYCVRELLMLGANRDIRDHNGNDSSVLWCRCREKPTAMCSPVCISSRKSKSQAM